MNNSSKKLKPRIQNPNPNNQIYKTNLLDILIILVFFQILHPEEAAAIVRLEGEQVNATGGAFRHLLESEVASCSNSK
jgi:hypothetical protein